MTDDRDDMSASEPSPHLSDDEIGRLERGPLIAGELLVFSDHLKGCASCRGRAAARVDLAATRARFEAAIGLADDHVPEDDVHAYADGTLDAERRREVDEHLEHCGSCASEISDLLQFARQHPDTRAGRAAWWYGALAAAAALLLASVVLGRMRPAAPVLMVLNDGGARIGIDALGNVDAVGALNAGDRSILRQAIVARRLTIPAEAASLVGAGGALRGPAEASGFRVIAPVGTAVLADRPWLRWTSLANGTTYVVRLRDETTGVTVTSPSLHAGEWIPDVPLTRGHTYVWQVEATAPGREITAPVPPDPAARFAILNAADAARLAQAPASHLVRGVLYANAGLFDAAEREMAELEAQNPGSEMVRRFVDQLSQLRQRNGSGIRR